MRTSIMFALWFLASILVAINPLTPDLQSVVRISQPNDWIPIQITLSEQYDSGVLLNVVRNMSPHSRKAFVREKLKSFTSCSQEDLLAWLVLKGAKDINSLWINNTIICLATPGIIYSLNGRNDIIRLDWNEERNMLTGTKSSPDNPASDSREIASNVMQVNAVDVWNLGFTGEDVIVALVDTGVRYTHVDLADHMWTSPSYPNHGYDYVNNDNNPLDDNGHGTHCAGTIAGDGSAGSQTGMAPDARIMAIKVSSSTGTGSESNVWLGYQFALDNDAQIISQSLGWIHSWNPNRTGWRQALANLNAAGLPVIIAGGNEGNYAGQYNPPDNIRTPADCPPPWLHPDQTVPGGLTATIAVGALTSIDTPAYFTSRGPCTWESVPAYMDYPYQPELGLIRPDISAPGVNIKSLDYSSNTGYTYMSGTSMAAPCVAGVVALILSKNPYLNPAEIDEILEMTSLHLTAIKSNSTGSGRVDALAAVNDVSFPNQPPNAADFPSPANAAANIIPALHLGWHVGSGTNTYTLYCGTDNPPTNLLAGVQTTLEEYNSPRTTLSYNTDYYWRVDTDNGFGNTIGNVWSFTTGDAPDESFESGNLYAFGWELTDNPWVIDTVGVLHGMYCMRSGTLLANSVSTIQTNRVVLAADTLKFYLKTSCQSNAMHNSDYLEFIINGIPRARCDGDTDWIEYKRHLEPGLYEFIWSYHKDGSVDADEDCVRIDYLTLPPCNNPPVNVTAQIQQSGDVLVSWAAPPDIGYVTGYKIYVNGVLSCIANTSPVSFSDSPIGYNSYQVSALYGEVESPQSAAALLANLPCPHNLEASVTGRQVTFTWQSPDSTRYIIGYRLYRNNALIQYIDINQTPANTATDSPPVSGVYTYYVTTLYSEGESIASNAVTIDFSVDNDDNLSPGLTGISRIYPNPFTSELQIDFSLAAKSAIKLEVYNLKGQLVRSVLPSTLDKSKHQTIWDGTDTDGKEVTQGIYFIRFETGNHKEMRKVMLVR